MHASMLTGGQSPAKLSASSIPAIKSSTLRAFRELLLHSDFAGTDASEESASREILKKLFGRGERVGKEEAQGAIKPSIQRDLTESSLLEEHDALVRARFQVQVHAGMFFLADFMKREHPSDLVLPIGPSGRHLANVTIRKKIGSALDLGCGCGIQSLLAARHADVVTATDINPRALALTRLNAELNEISNIEILEGRNFEPVLGRKFDLIVANLPYVVAPQRKYIYRDPDQPGDRSVRSMLLETPEYLNEGGFAHVMISWIDRKGEPWWALSKEMLQCAHTDSWLNHNGSKSAEQYASMWITTDAKKEPEKYSKEKDEWTNWYRSQGYRQFGLGLMTLRRRSNGKNWGSAIEVKKFLSDTLGDELQQLFENQDDLENRADLRGEKFVVRNLEVEPQKLFARTQKGFLFQTKVSGNTINVVNELRNGFTLGEALERVTGSLEVQDQLLAEITQLLNFGMLKVDKS